MALKYAWQLALNSLSVNRYVCVYGSIWEGGGCAGSDYHAAGQKHMPLAVLAHFVSCAQCTSTCLLQVCLL